MRTRNGKQVKYLYLTRLYNSFVFYMRNIGTITIILNGIIDI